MSKPPTSADTAWHAELLRMESHLSAAEGLLLSDTAEASRESFEEYLQSPPWTPTPALGPLPEALAARARALLERQQELSARIAAAMELNTRQRGFAHRVQEATATRPRPVYLDVQA